MKSRKQLIADFEARSVMLFTAFVLTTSMAHAQQAPVAPSGNASTTASPGYAGSDPQTATPVAQAPSTNPAINPAANAPAVAPAPTIVVVPAPAADAPIPSHGPWTPLQVAQAFQRADANGDGSLTRAEALNLAIKPMSFEEMDANKDGVLSRTEFEDALGR